MSGGKTFDQYKAEHVKEPFPLPMPDGSTIPVPLGTIDQQHDVREAVGVAAQAGTVTVFTGLMVMVGPENAAKIADAWGKLPPEAWTAVMTDMREHFGQGNSEASPPS